MPEARLQRTRDAYDPALIVLSRLLRAHVMIRQYRRSTDNEGGTPTERFDAIAAKAYGHHDEPMK